MSDPTKRCNKCGTDFPAMPEFFWKRERGKFGLMGQCILCMKNGIKADPRRALLQWERHARYRKDNREKLRVISRDFYATHKEDVRQTKQNWQDKNPAYKKEYYRKNQERIKEKSTLWQQDNPDRVLERTNRWRRKNPAKNKAAWERRHALLCAARSIFPAHTAEDWQSILEAHGFACAYCQRTNLSLTEDHILAVVRGGLDNKENINPACRSCNSSKGSKVLEEWLPKRLLYLERKAARRAA